MKKPISNSVVAKNHTPIYSVHRYFARRPHNVFSNLISHYLNEPSLILDPFSGGGVTLIEGLSLKHKVIGSEINPIACFITKGQLSYIDPKKILDAAIACTEYCDKKIGFTYKDGKDDVYWYSWESIATCPKCQAFTRLNPTQSEGSGTYVCENCVSNFKAKLIHKNAITPSQLCIFTGDPWSNNLETSLKDVSSKSLSKKHKKILSDLAATNYVVAAGTKTLIPKCNLEKESALHQKGFTYFEDFISEKNQSWILCYAEAIELYANNNEKLNDVLFYILSASLRYISRFSSLNESWRKGHKPLEWAKSNFWTPYAFIELNPKVAFIGRVKAYLKSLEDHSRRFGREIRPGTAQAVQKGKADYAIINKPSQALSTVNDNSVDLILTDPPYGSYLSYGELSGFWLAWLKRIYAPLKNINIINSQEAICSRKVHKDNYKTFSDYQIDLTSIFKECFRVLKPGHYMVFTFNNKEPEAWLALLRAVKSAGFILPKGGVIFQDGVEAYKRTIALRRNGAIHGDFIYSFLKPVSKKTNAKSTTKFSWRDAAEKIINTIFRDSVQIRNTDLYLELNKSLLPILYEHLGSDNSQDTSDLNDFNYKNLEALLKNRLYFTNGMWKKNKTTKHL